MHLVFQDQNTGKWSLPENNPESHKDQARNLRLRSEKEPSKEPANAYALESELTLELNPYWQRVVMRVRAVLVLR